MTDWYYVQAGHPYGPFTLDQLRQRLAVMPPDTLVWHSGLDAWTPARALAEASGPHAPVTVAAAAVPGHHYAEWPLRAAALLVDALLVVGAPILTLALVHAVGWTDEHGDPKGVGLVLTALAVFAGFGAGVWNRIVRDGTTGRSLGRQVTGTRLVGEATGHPIGMPLALVRQVAHLLDDPCVCLPVGFLWPLWDGKRQTFADKVTRTVVVREVV